MVMEKIKEAKDVKMVGTKSVTQRSAALAQLESILAQHPFGNSTYITEQLHICYERRLHKISCHLPVAGQLLHALRQADPSCRYRVIGDMVVRCAVQHALKQVETGTQYGLPLGECEEVFRDSLRLLREGVCAPLGSGLVHRLGAAPYHAWIWSEERSSNVVGRAFRYLVYDNFGEHLCTPNADELAMLAKGAQLLGDLLPVLSRSALSHAHLVGVFPPIGDWIGTASCSEFRLSGAMFLSRLLLSNPWGVAEAMFHEALHHQMYDFRQGHSLLQPDFARDEAPRVHSLWNLPDSSRGNYWDTHRALAAFHVYVHLALFWTVAEHRSQELEEVYGKLFSKVGSYTAFARAHYLAEQIRALCWQELGLAGKRFLDWFSSVLDVLNPSPPPEGSYVHLLLDRYRREMKHVDLFQSNPKRSPNFSQQIASIAKNEINSTRRVLAIVNAEAALGRFNDALAHLSDEELGTQFSQVRRVISETILGASPNGYTLCAPRVGDEIVKQMIESSSERLRILLAR